jgi:hypothetical protein
MSTPYLFDRSGRISSLIRMNGRSFIISILTVYTKLTDHLRPWITFEHRTAAGPFLVLHPGKPGKPEDHKPFQGSAQGPTKGLTKLR